MINKIIYSVWLYYREYLFRKKVRKIAVITGVNTLADSVEKEYKRRWEWAHKKPSPLYPRIFAGINGIPSSLYIPENIYYNRIEPVLNNKSFTPAYSDKNFYEAYLPAFRDVFPETVIRGINGNFFDGIYRQVVLDDHINFALVNGKEYILKPSVGSSGGADLAVVRRQDNICYFNNLLLCSTEEFSAILKTKYSSSFVLQERIRQHPWFAGFNESSVNTVRMFTYRSVKDNKVHILHSVIRFGRTGNIVDNQAAGGFSCGINESGKLNGFAIDKYGHKYSGLKYVNVNAGTAIPGLEEMESVSSSIAFHYHYHRLLGFDFSFDSENRVRLLEINCKNIEINFLQMNNGPLFGQFTDEIIEYCRTNRGSVVFDFYV